MKKGVFILFCLLASTLLTSCYYNRSTGECSCVSKTIEMRVNSADWQYDANAQRFFCHFNRSEITSTVYNKGQWTICREYNSGTNQAYQVALPESVFKVEDLGAGGKIYYTQHIDYAVGIGWVEITLTNSDYGYDKDPQSGYLINPEGMVFLMQIQY